MTTRHRSQHAGVSVLLEGNDSSDVKYGYLSTLRFATPELLAAQHTVSGLIEQEQETFTPEGDLADGIERSRGRLSYVGEYRGGFADTVFLTADIRRDDNENFQDFTTWRTAVSIPLKGLGMRPHASVGTSVKFPSMFEHYGTFPTFFIPNPGLKPEESFGWDAGVEYTFFKRLFILDVTYFNADLTDEIDVAGFPQKPFNRWARARARASRWRPAPSSAPVCRSAPPTLTSMRESRTIPEAIPPAAPLRPHRRKLCLPEQRKRQLCRRLYWPAG